MKTAIQQILTDAAARSAEAVEKSAVSRDGFEPWGGQ